jgi:hypothetical protein
VTDYNHGIIAGVADFGGSPHVFVVERLDDTLYRVTPVIGVAGRSPLSSPPVVTASNRPLQTDRRVGLGPGTRSASTGRSARARPSGVAKTVARIKNHKQYR